MVNWQSSIGHSMYVVVLTPNSHHVTWLDVRPVTRRGTILADNSFYVHRWAT